MTSSRPQVRLFLEATAGWTVSISNPSILLTQSFVPALSAIGFVEFEFQDIPGNGSNGATVYVNLWTGSPKHQLGVTTRLNRPGLYAGWIGNNGSFAGNTDLYFTSPIASTPGQTYYLQPVVSSGDNPWDIMVLTKNTNGQLLSEAMLSAYFGPMVSRGNSNSGAVRFSISWAGNSSNSPAAVPEVPPHRCGGLRCDVAIGPGAGAVLCCADSLLAAGGPRYPRRPLGLFTGQGALRRGPISAHTLLA